MMSKKLFVALVLLALCGLNGCKKKRDINKQPYAQTIKNAGENLFGLVILSSVEGYVEPCGCTSNPLGGIARFSQVFEDINTTLKNQSAIIDTGNLLFDSPKRHAADLCQDNARLDLLLSSMTKLGLKYTFSGQLDVARGSDYRDALYKKHGIKTLEDNSIKIISTNKYDIALVGISKPDKNFFASLRKQLVDAKKKSNIKLVIAISHMDQARSETFLGRSKEIDIILQGKTEHMTPAPPKMLAESGPLLIQGGRQGQFLNILLLQNLEKRNHQRITLDTRAYEQSERLDLLKKRVKGLQKQIKSVTKKRADFLGRRLKIAESELNSIEQQKGKLSPLLTPNLKFQSIALTKAIDSNPEVKKLLSDYEESIPKLVKTCEENIECPTLGKGEPHYVGVNTCKSCHQEAFDVWRKAVFLHEATDESGKKITRQIGHSKAWKTLVDANKDVDRSCIGCHSIGFMKEGGYCKASEVDFRIDVQCESCHGPGSLHAKSGNKSLIKRKVGEETCRGCHHVPHIPSFESFNYDDKVIKILGKGHGENLLKQIKHRAKKAETNL